VRVLDEGLRSNPSAAGLRAYLGHVLFERSERWPSLRPRMRSARGRDPVDEAADLLGAAVAADPGNGLAVYWMTDALLARGRRALEAAGAAPCPAAAADFRRAAAALRAFAATAPDAGRDAAETLALGCDSMAAAAESADPAERKRLLERADAPQPGK
jgi:hypothetical protein